VLVTQQPIFKKFWHAFMPLADLQDGPKPFTLLGLDIVLFLDAHGTRRPCTARYGHAWVALEEPIADIPSVPEFDDPAFRTIFQFYEPWATSPMRALENSFDNAHKC
jgi:phenylpropionate dioxygenase-like ring-hydroxylating dioxygenase large terminal subunit